MFWKRCCLYEAFTVCMGQMKIVFLGFGKQGEELLAGQEKDLETVRLLLSIKLETA